MRLYTREGVGDMHASVAFLRFRRFHRYSRREALCAALSDFPWKETIPILESDKRERIVNLKLIRTTSVDNGLQACLSAGFDVSLIMSSIKLQWKRVLAGMDFDALTR